MCSRKIKTGKVSPRFVSHVINGILSMSVNLISFVLISLMHEHCNYPTWFVMYCELDECWQLNSFIILVSIVTIYSFFYGK